MNKAYLLVGTIVLSILALAAINLISNYSSGNELDYYLLKETTQAAMMDSLDTAYWGGARGVYRIDKEKFVENFVLRFASNVDNSREYDIKFYDIDEVPPKVTVQIDSLNSSLSVDGKSNINISTRLEGILETNNKKDPILTTKYLKGDY